MKYQCSGYSRLVCGGCVFGREHEMHDHCKGEAFCSTIQDEVHCEPVEEEGDE